MTPELASWSPATDTAEIRADLRGPWFERETVELNLLDLYPPAPLVRLSRRVRLGAVLRKTGAVLLLIAGLMALSAEPSSANPVHDAPRYYGPTVTCWTAEQLFPWATDRTCR